MNNSAEKEAKGPKRRKLSTLNHIHETLFKDGHESDIKILALNREWNLHKMILSQSPYFKSMFGGSWVEKTLKEIKLEIEDDVNITSEALHKVFESLYSDEIQVESSEAVSVVACATFLQLDDLINHCSEVMKACINIDTAVSFFDASELYGIKEVKNVSFDWLCRNVEHIVETYPKFLTSMSEDLLKELFTSPDLCVNEEGNLLLILAAWVFLKENSSDFHFDSWEDLNRNSLQYFERFMDGTPFLETDSGIAYQSLFRALRLQNLLLDVDFEKIEKLNIFPMEWIMPVFRTQWYHTLKIHQGVDVGPKSVSKEVFNRVCERTSFHVSNGKAWRYSDYDFGFGLAFTYKNGRFKIKRLNAENNSYKSNGPVSLNGDERYIMYRVSLFSEDNYGRVRSKAETDIETASMALNEEIEVLTFTPPFFPVESLRCRMNILLTTP